ncbi:hypothetical protein AB0K18_30300 [Nonomuraea sp. NPDC049421]|uniref:hypothetical protein n=1 Tax=Nonomuraea sp. NPDC049421 TaxID=3155275 RepID=UPI003431EEC4
MDMKLEVIVVPVTDVDLAKSFYTGLGWRLDPSVTTFTSASDLAAALRRAAAAHGEHEARTGAEDPDWPDWYADYLVGGRAGSDLPI